MSERASLTARWFGQAAFLLAGESRVMIDPLGSPRGLSRPDLKFDFPPIEGVAADLVLVTHEHFDHNGVEAVTGSPLVIRSTAGRFDSPVGEVLAVASEHDPVAGTARGPNTIFVFELGGVRICHLGDFGQSGLRPEQRDAIGAVDVLFVPVGGGPTIDAERAAGLVAEFGPRVTVPMHYRTPAINFLEPVDAFLAAVNAPVERRGGGEFDLAALLARDEPVVVVPAAPAA